MRRFFVLLCILSVSLMAGPLACGDDDNGTNAEADGDGVRPGDADPDGDSEPDPDGDAEPDPDGDAEPDPDGDSEPDPDGDTEPDPDGDNEIEPGDYGDQQGYLDIIADNRFGATINLQEATEDIEAGDWVRLSNPADAAAEIQLSSNCLKPNCDGGAEFDCETFEPSAVAVEDGDFHVYPWDGIYYVEDDVEECTDVFEMENVDLNLTLCVGQGPITDGEIANEQCLQVGQVNPSQSGQLAIVLQQE